MFRLAALIALAIPFLIFFSSCEHDPEMPAIANGVDSTVCFDNKILPLIQKNCSMSGCHDGSSEFSLNNYQEISGKIVAGNPNSSELYKVITPNKFTNKPSMPPSPKPHLDNADITLIELWILEEANSFSKVVMPVLANNCQSCHSGETPSGNLTLTDYSQIKEAVNTKSLLKHILEQDNYSLMPPSGQLTDCDIAKIKKWISNGLPNN